MDSGAGQPPPPLPPLEEPIAVRFARWCESNVESMLSAIENQHGLWYIGIFQASSAHACAAPGAAARRLPPRARAAEAPASR